MKYLSACICILGMLFFTSCQKEDQDIEETTVSETEEVTESDSTNNDTTNTNDNSSPLALELTSDKKRMKIGEEANITATATGGSGGLTYNWSVNTSLAIDGSGAEVKLLASCYSCVGENEITCIVKDSKDNSITEKITITIM